MDALYALEVKGIIAAMVTPFDEKLKINEAAARRLIDRLINAGVSGLFILGTNGEFHVLSQMEKLHFARLVIEHVRRRVPVYVGTGGNSTAEVVSLSRRMEQLGADALSVITPYFVPPTQQELAVHFRTVAESVKTPIVLYNIPKNTGVNLDAATVRELAKVANIIGIKDSSGRLENIGGYLEASRGENFAVLSGSDSLILKALKAGAAGAIAATANLIADVDVSIYRHYVHGELEAAEEAQARLERLRSVLKLGTVPSILKKAVELSGIPVGPARPPVGAPTGETLHSIKEMLEYYDIGEGGKPC